MFKSLLYVIFLAAVATSNNNFEQYYRSQINPFATSESLDHSIRIQSAVRVSEVALSDQDGCLRRSMCVLGAISSTREDGHLPKMSIANGAQNFLHIVQRMIAVAGMTGLTKDELPNLRQVIASNIVGKSAGDLRMCESLFPCHTSVEEIKDEALFVEMSPNHSSRPGLFATLFAPTMADTFKSSTEVIQGRSTCKITGALCPGITIGCAVCGIFAPGTCGDTCIVAGLYCGSSGYACQYQASKNSQNTEDTPEEEVEVDEEEIEVQEPEEEVVEGTRKQKNPRFYSFQF